MEKICSNCKRLLPLTSECFYKDSSHSDGFRSQCKDCIKTSMEKKKKKKPIAKDGYKICTKCKSELPKTNEYFFSYKKFPDGLTYDCKKCRGYEYGKKRVKTFKSNETHKICTCCEKLLPKTFEYFTVNSSHSDGFYSICKECKHEKWKENYKTFYENNKDRIYQNQKRYSLKYPEKITSQRRKYEAKNKVKLAIKAHERRAKARKLISNFDVDDWKNCKNAFGYSCAYCGKDSKKLTQDHFVPLNKGGEYTKQNIIPVCKSCNSSKIDNDFFKWYPKQKFYSTEREQTILKSLGNKNNIQQLALL